jgi:hypothetical protein
VFLQEFLCTKNGLELVFLQQCTKIGWNQCSCSSFFALKWPGIKFLQQFLCTKNGLELVFLQEFICPKNGLESKFLQQFLCTKMA